MTQEISSRKKDGGLRSTFFCTEFRCGSCSNSHFHWGCHICKVPYKVSKTGKTRHFKLYGTLFFMNIVYLLVFSRNRVFPKSYLLYCLKSKCYYQNDRMVREIISWFRQKRGPGIVCYHRNSFCWGTPTFQVTLWLSHFSVNHE